MLVGAIPAAVALLADRSRFARIPFIGTLEQRVNTVSDVAILGWIAVAIIFLALVKLVYFYALNRVILQTIYNIRVRLSRWIFESYMYAPWPFHLEHHSSELLRNSTTEIYEVVGGVIQPILNVMFGMVMAGFVLIMIIGALPIQAFLAFAITIAAAGALLMLLRKSLEMEGESAKLERKRMLSSVQEGLANLIDARLLSREGWFISRFMTSASRFSTSQNRIFFVSRMLPYAIEFVSIGGLMIVVFLLARQSGDLKTILPQITLIGIGLVRLRQAVSTVSSNVAKIQYSLPSLQNVYDHTVALKELIEEPDTTTERCEFKDAIDVINLGFVYPQREEPVLNGVNLSIAKGSSIAFVGETGCGKSTLLQVLLGLLAPTTGCITVDGVDVRRQLRRWRNLIGYVPQQIHLLDATIEQNIVMGETETDQRRLKQAIRIAQLDDVLAGQPDGLQTIVGEDGTRLSGGQRQRIGLARSLYREPELIILDEATSALDYQTEAAITKALNSIPWVATKVIVAHRLSTVQNCDMIVILKDGQISDTGTFAALCERNHTFAAGAAG
ncbi:MAG: ABC transporter ATP-binding protein [Planctomycetaceae bacterium]